MPRVVKKSIDDNVKHAKNSSKLFWETISSAPTLHDYVIASNSFIWVCISAFMCIDSKYMDGNLQ
jgi:hypothetical protein